MHALPAILRFDRLAVERIWGGQKLGSWLGMEMAEGVRIGETWEIHDRGEAGSSQLLEPVAGCRDLHELMVQHAEAVLGAARPDAQGRFPLMLKFLDAQDRLSLQVHPDDALAATLGAADSGTAASGTADSGKDEAWVVLRADADAWLVRGLVEGRTKAELFSLLEQGGDVEALLQRLPSHVGDVVEIPAGTLHCIGPGNLLYEIQQNSDLTYRLSDWGRVGQDGRPRDLHLAQGRRAWKDLPSAKTGQGDGDPDPEASQNAQVLVDCSAFFLRRLLPEDTESHETRHLPQILTAVRGSAWVRCGEEQSLLKEGETCLIRGGVPTYTLSPETSSETSPETAHPQAGVCELLLATPADRGEG
jgi:mannose-6-phosphate isomerase